MNLLFPEMNEADAAKKCLLEVWPDCPSWLLSDEMDFVVKAMIKFKQLGEPTTKKDNTNESELEKAKELLKTLISNAKHFGVYAQIVSQSDDKEIEKFFGIGKTIKS